MLTLQVSRPKDYTLGRTQSYRVVLVVEGEVGYEPAEKGSEDRYHVDKHVFVVVRDGGLPHFDRVALPVEFSTVATDPGLEEYRTNVVDLYLPSKDLADGLVREVIKDIEALLSNKYGRRFTYTLSGGDLDPQIQVLP